MKKILLSCIALLAMFNVALAQESKEFYKIGNRWAIGAGAGTEGVSVDFLLISASISLLVLE